VISRVRLKPDTTNTPAPHAQQAHVTEQHGDDRSDPQHAGLRAFGHADRTIGHAGGQRKRLIHILEPTSKTVDAISKLTLPAGVDIRVKA